MKLNSQKNIILKAMIENPKKTWWSAKDFQSGKYFVGYEATARMSELLEYPFIVGGKDGRFRVIALDHSSKELKEYKDRLGE